MTCAASLGTRESTAGRRKYTAATCAGCFGATGRGVFLLAASAALSEAAADTVSSELGQARSEKAHLITTWEEVAAGTDGGITWGGTRDGVTAALFVSSVCYLTGLLPLRWLLVSAAGGVAGMIADSYLGALFERRRLLNNDWVNFLGTLVAAGVAFVIAIL